VQPAPYPGYPRRGPTLLLLDNLEGLVDAAAAPLSAWLAAAPQLRLLVTSQARLRVAGEELVELGALGEREVVDLFEQRAAAARPGFALSDDDRPRVAELGRRLDGLPLAIELAAARMDVLSPERLLGRLADRFRLLTRSRRGAVARHATLRAAIQWSWDLLDPVEQAALSGCSVFAGGFGLEAAEAIVVLPGDAWLLDVLTSLRERSLLNRVDGPGQEPRFACFESVRAFAASTLTSRQRQEIERRHAAWFLDWGRERAERLTHVGGGPGGDELALELENLRAVHRRFRELEPLFAARAVAVLRSLLALRGPASLLRELLGEGVELAAAAGLDGQDVLVELLEAFGWALILVRDAHGATERLERARRLDPGCARPHVRLGLGTLATLGGDPEAADALFDEAEQAWRARGERGGLGRVHAVRGTSRLLQRRLPEAAELFERALVLFRETGRRGSEARCLNNLAGVLLQRGDLEGAARSNRSALAIHEELRDEWALAMTLAHAGVIALHRGQPDEAVAPLRRAEEVAARTGHLFIVGTARLQLAHAAAGCERWAAAAAGYVAAAAAFEGLPAPPMVARSRVLAEVCEALAGRREAPSEQARAALEALSCDPPPGGEVHQALPAERELAGRLLERLELRSGRLSSRSRG